MSSNYVKISGVVRSPKLFQKQNIDKLDFQIENIIKNRPERIDCSAWNELATDMYENCKEGTEVVLEGSIRKDAWKNTSDMWVVRTYIKVSKYQFVDNVYDDERFDSAEFDGMNTVDPDNIISEDDLPY